MLNCNQNNKNKPIKKYRFKANNNNNKVINNNNNNKVTNNNNNYNMEIKFNNNFNNKFKLVECNKRIKL